MTYLNRIQSQRVWAIYIALLLLLSLQCSYVSAQSDALEEAAARSLLAPRSLMLDIEQAGNKLVAVGERGHILFSNDLGASWTQAQVPVRSTLTASFFVNEEQGWVVGHDGLVLRTRDGGVSWEKLLDGYHANRLMLDHAQALYAQTEADLAIAVDAEASELEVTLEDLAIVVEDAESFISEGASRPFLDVWFRNANEGFIVGAFGLFFHTEDGGDNWTPWFDKIQNPDILHLNAIRHIGDTLYIAAEAGSLYRSDDLGKSWSRLLSPYNGTFFGVVGAGENGIIAYGLRGNAFISIDKGESWNPVDTDTDAGLFGGDNLADGSIVLVGAGGMVLRLSEQGELLQSFQTPYKLPLSAALAIETDAIAVGFGGIQPLLLMNK